MTDKRIADIFDIRSRFMRSVQVERDFYESDTLEGYVLTDFAKSCFSRIAEGLKPDSGRRAWRMTGDYGSGKSSFALLLARSFSDLNEVPLSLRKEIGLPEHAGKSLKFIPILCTCSRRSIGKSIIEVLHRTEMRLYSSVNKGRIKEIELALRVDEPSEEQIISCLEKLNLRVIADGKGRGLLLIIDELGKFLEYAAIYPTQQDVFLLQRIAEKACRSGNKPIFVVCLLHQGFNAYADQLNQSAQREWEKVAGRFEEIVFNQPVEQIARLIASALNTRINEVPRSTATTLQGVMEQALNLGWFGACQRRSLMELGKSLFPLHPTVLPVLTRFFRRFGQNERSLFSFLLSNEPFGLQAFSERKLSGVHLYCLHDLFDYVRTNFGYRLGANSYRSHWNLIESVIEGYSTDNLLHNQILKTVGILNLLNDDLIPSQDALVCALDSGNEARKKEIKAGLQELCHVKRVLYNRGRGGGLCLWPHTSVDLEKAYDEARRAVQIPLRVSSSIKEYLDNKFVVARRHYIETGNLRFFDVRYSPVSEISDLFNAVSYNADGLIIIPLCETVAEQNEAKKFANSKEIVGRENCLVAVPQPLKNLGSLLQEVQRWEWIATSIFELNGDRYAREEVSRQLQAARLQLAAGLESRIGFKQFSGQTTLEWFHKGQLVAIRSGRELLAFVSKICDKTYPNAPRIHNELVNRRNLSTAAASARMRLIESMFTAGRTQLLGMDPEKKPPEMSMYLSVLLNTGVHQRHGNAWHIGEPEKSHDGKFNVRPAIKRISEFIREQGDTRVLVTRIFDELKKPPYGVRNGLIPIFLTAFAIIHEKDGAFYKDGTFLREMTAEIMLELIKSPERFEIQYCKIEGVRAEIFVKLIEILELKTNEKQKIELLDIVKPLCVFIAQLPPYARNTKKISKIADSVREAILNARDPAKLLFTELPKVCGIETTLSGLSWKDSNIFVKNLKTALDELRAAYPDLQGRMRNLLQEVFEISGSFPKYRNELSKRAEQVSLGVNEPKLRAFCLRLMDSGLPESEWLESIGSFLAFQPPIKWHDTEEDTYFQELSQLSRRFRRVESIVFSSRKSLPNEVAMRLAITRANGAELEKVIHYNSAEEEQLRKIQMQFEELLSKNQRLALAAASQAIWKSLERHE